LPPFRFVVRKPNLERNEGCALLFRRRRYPRLGQERLKIPPPNGYVAGCSQSILDHGFCRIQWPAVGGMAYVVVNGTILTVQAHDPGSFFGPMPKREYTLKDSVGALSCLGPDGEDLAIEDRFSHCAPMLNAELAKISAL
jgi:hypothetical protein